MNDPITRFVPHRRTMLLIDKIVDKNPQNFTVELLLTKDSLLATEMGVPSYCGLEYMAQSIAAFNYITFQKQGEVKIGFILAIRNYESKKSFFPLNSTLHVKVHPNLILDKSGSFDCQIFIDDQVWAKGKITAYVPDKEELHKLKQEAQ